MIGKSLFENVFVIHAHRRYDRKLFMDEQMRRLDIPFTLSPAIPYLALSDKIVATWSRNDQVMARQEYSRNALISCTLSHLATLNKVFRTNGLEYALILEDDALFHPDLLNQLEAPLADVPDDWQILFLGGHLVRTHHLVAPNVARVYGVKCSHAYLLKKSPFLQMEEAFRKFPQPIDDLWNTLLGESYPGYAILPFLAVQAASFSDVSQRFNPMLNLRPDSWLSSLGHDEYRRAVKLETR